MKEMIHAVGVAILATILAQACSSDPTVPGAGLTDGGLTDTGLTDSARGPESTGQSCKVADDCYPGLDGGFVKGEVRCLDRVTGGYCTHLCQTDADCCAVPGECRTGFKQVCSPFESTGLNMCFLSCEAADLRPAPDGGVLDETAFCQIYGGAELKCRSSGGGSKNRKVCVP